MGFRVPTPPWMVPTSTHSRHRGQGMATPLSPHLPGVWPLQDGAAQLCWDSPQAPLYLLSQFAIWLSHMPASFLAMDWPLGFGRASFCLPSGALISLCTLAPVIHPPRPQKGLKYHPSQGLWSSFPTTPSSRERMAFVSFCSSFPLGVYWFVRIISSLWM